MNAITPEEVRRIAALARLALTDEEIARVTRDLSGILEHFSSIGDIDTANISPSDDISGLLNVSREDVARQNTLCSAQELVEGYVRVPGVFGESSVS